MTRSAAVRVLSVTCLSIGVLFFRVPLRYHSASGAEGDIRQKPNIIFILSDDVAQGDLGCYGQKLIRTPNLDRMAAEGTRYLQAYCGTTVCAPSRTSLITGLHMGHCPIRANREIQPEGQMPLPAGTGTVGSFSAPAVS
ncbi:MAG TPA: sulfatase-like hydrolase/transferase [Candidatus Anammoximicrobium sp.]|nr:sulfatase-like hydrolase/transferase [Candidatus Anammoximicrobium sp.]